MKSELHQRIRAARNFADLSQQAIAKVCGVTRPAVSQWEALEVGKRTTPSLEQVKTIAQVTGVPMEWLTDDDAEPDSVWQFIESKTWQPKRKHSPAQQPPSGASRADFLAGVRFEIALGAGPLLSGFMHGDLDWAQGDLAVVFVLPGEAVEPAAGRLLLCGAPRRRMVFVAAPIPVQATALQQALAIELISAEGVSAAAKAILP